MIELLLVLLYLALLFLLAGRFDARHFEQASARYGGPSARPRAPTPPFVPRLRIEGTERRSLRTTRFLIGFGVDPRTVRDICVYARQGGRETLPPGVAVMLGDLHQRGCAFGAELIAFLFHGRTLREGEAIYFALVVAPELRLIAFVDKLHAA